MTKTVKFITAIFLCAFWVASSYAAQTSLDGEWQGALVREGSEAKVSLNFKTTADGVEGTMTMPDVGMFRQPLSNISLSFPKAHFEQENIAAVFDGEIRDGKITGNLQVIGLTGTFYLERAKEEPLPYKQEEVRFRNGNITLGGTLTVPSTRGSHPAIVFTHGGGPDTRDLSRFYADLFARRGIATLIYDKRGVGASSPDLVDWGRSSFEDLAGDALAGVEFLKTRKEINPKRIGLYGPSNGGWVVEYAAARSKDVAFLIVLSGGGIPSWESEVYRVEAETRAEGFSEDEIKAAVAFMQKKFEVARTGQGWEQFAGLIEKSRKEKWFRFVAAPRSLELLQEAWNGQFKYDAYADIQKLKIPVLAIFGELDTEVPANRIADATRKALRSGKSKDYTVKVFPRATHGILVFPEEGKPWHFFRYADGFLDLMTDWVSKQAKS
ncbi:MAG: alpha/beta fold hydrolase [Acidobacteria bacterium]|nr:alpha/beta fold hydrolase [Acidobacteriota bacterium]